MYCIHHTFYKLCPPVFLDLTTLIILAEEYTVCSHYASFSILLSFNTIISISESPDEAAHAHKATNAKEMTVTSSTARTEVRDRLTRDTTLEVQNCMAFTYLKWKKNAFQNNSGKHHFIAQCRKDMYRKCTSTFHTRTEICWLVQLLLVYQEKLC
jgi:hypothetical protein